MNILVDGQTLQSPEVNRGIGVYFKNVLNNMVKQSFIHNWYIAVENRSCLSALDPWVSRRLTPVENRLFAPGADYERSTAYTDALERIVEEKSIDVYWNPNPLMVNVLFLNRELECTMYFMLHDIIPVIMPVTEWSKTVRAEYKRRLEYLQNKRVTLLCNSKATKHDFEERICQRNGIYVTPLAADSRKFFRKRTAPGIHKQVSIVFIGGFDYRKNMDGAVKAFARACRKYRGNDLIDRAVFKIVCSAPEEQKQRFYSQVESLGVGGRVELTGFVSDKELADLLHNCDLFFFPSLYEGFGLPIVEAMLSGAFVLSADNSSLPEVCGEHAVFCDANDIEDMADKMMWSLTLAEKESVSDKLDRQRYARTFSWQRTAKQTLEIFETGHERDVEANGVGVRKKKIAIITPWPMQETGIANYVYKLIPYWAKFFDIDVFVDNSTKMDRPPLENKYGGLYMLDELDRRHGDYDHLLYQIGNNAEYHKGIYQYLRKYPGVAEIHDYILHPFFYHAYYLHGDKRAYCVALMEGYGDAGLEHYQAVREKRMDPDNEAFPMSQSVAAISKQVILHNHWSKAQMRDVMAEVIPLACFERESASEDRQRRLVEEVRRKYELRESEILISCFGFVNANKRPEVSLQVVKELRDRGYLVKLVFWGRPGVTGLEKSIQRLGLTNTVRVAGYLEDPEYETALVLSDIIINLRYPSMGESSATLCEAFQYGKPVIVTDINQYREYPDEVCWKVPVGAGEVESLTEMTAYLINHPEVRQALGQNARAYAEKILSPSKIARQYQKILERV